ncbi:MAG TPA: YihY/virulence factor BrkB family protein [Acidimicrobiia bacterium]|jgi:membrane protein
MSMSSPEQPGDPAEDLVRHAREEFERADREVTEAVDDAVEEADQEFEQRLPRTARVARVAVAVLHEQSAEQVGLAASGAAFWLVISALPTAIAAVSVFGLVVSPERVATDLGDLASAVPGSFGSLFAQQLRHVAESDHAGLSLGLVVSLILAIWSASAGVYNLDRAIRESYGLRPQRYVEARSRALLGAIGAVLLFGAAAVITSTVVAQSSPLVAIVGALVALVAITVLVAALYRFSVGSHLTPRALMPGAIASAIGVVLVTFGFGAYVAVSKRYAAVYGAFAGIVIGMLAIYLAVYVVLLGAVLNMQLAGKRST